MCDGEGASCHCVLIPDLAPEQEVCVLCDKTSPHLYSDTRCVGNPRCVLAAPPAGHQPHAPSTTGDPDGRHECGCAGCDGYISNDYTPAPPKTLTDLEHRLTMPLDEAIARVQTFPDQIATLQAEVERLTAERDTWQMSHEECHELRLIAEAERDQARAVVEAARAIADCIKLNHAIFEDHSCLDALSLALDAATSPPAQDK